MPAPLRGRMESAFGANLAAVRLHTGPDAAEMSRRISAGAFTYGHDVYFRDGMPDTSTAGGMHVLAHEIAHTLERGPAPSGARAEPLRRWLRINGKRYTSENRAEVENLEDPIPGGWDKHIDAQVDWYPSPDGSKWLQDTGFELKNFSQQTQSKPMLKITHQDPLSESPASTSELSKGGKTQMRQTRSGPSESRRLLPKNENRKVASFRLFKKSWDKPDDDDLEAPRQNAVHWELECDATGGKTRDKTIKVDLINGSYRILYDSAPIGPDKIRKEGEKARGDRYEEPSTFTLTKPVTVKTVYETALAVARQLGAWQGNPGINCQDFALAMLARFEYGSNDKDRLGVEQEWRDSVRG